MAVPRVARFLAVGVLNTAFGYALFALLAWLGLPYPLAIGAATVAGVAFNFLTTGSLVFGDRRARLLPRFAAVYAAVYAANVAAVAGLLHLGLNLYLANALAILPLALLAYGLQRRFVFAAS